MLAIGARGCRKNGGRRKKWRPLKIYNNSEENLLSPKVTQTMNKYCEIFTVCIRNLDKLNLIFRFDFMFEPIFDNVSATSKVFLALK